MVVNEELKPFATKEELTVECGCVLWGIRIVIPNRFIQILLNELHMRPSNAYIQNSLALFKEQYFS